MIKLSIVFQFILGTTFMSYADSGGPYEGVPDLEEGRIPIIFRNPDTNKALSYYLSNIPQLIWDNKLGEPVTYSWASIKGYHASFRLLGHVRGRRLYEVRYVSDKRIAQGLDYTSAILILAKAFDSSEGKEKLTPVYYTSGGVVYNHTAEYLPKADKHGAIVVRTHYSGNGNQVSETYIRGTEDFNYERFTPQNK